MKKSKKILPITSKGARNPKAAAPDSHSKPSVPFTGTPSDVASLLDAIVTVWRNSKVRHSHRELTSWEHEQIEMVLAQPDAAVQIQRMARLIVLEITIALLTVLAQRASNEQGALKLGLELCGLQPPENSTERNPPSPEVQMDVLERAMLDNFREVLGMPPKSLPSPSNSV